MAEKEEAVPAETAPQTADARGNAPDNSSIQSLTPRDQAPPLCPKCNLPVRLNPDGSVLCRNCPAWWPSRADVERNRPRAGADSSTPDNGRGSPRDLETLLKLPPSELTDAELVMVKQRTSQDSRWRENAGDQKAKADERRRELMAELDPLSPEEYALRRQDLSKKYKLSLTDLDRFYSQASKTGSTRKGDAKQTTPGPETPEKTFFQSPSHGVAADLLVTEYGKDWIFEQYDPDGRGMFFRRINCYCEPILDTRHRMRVLLEGKIDSVFEQLKNQQASNRRDIYEMAGKALQKARTRDFLSSARALFSERVAKKDVPWNATPETIPTLTQVIDFSGSEVIARDALPNEFFRSPVPLTAEEILSAGEHRRFDQFMSELFPDEDTRKSALHCSSACIANKAQKTFQLWNNKEGDGGKNTLMDFLMRVLPSRMTTLKGALILYKGNQSERQFGEIALRGQTAGFFDEVGGCFDIGPIKRYTGLSFIHGEAKFREAVDFPQTWALIALCNKLPFFFPEDDTAFLERVFVLPFGSVFYANEESYQRHIIRGVNPARLKLAKDKDQIIKDLLIEHPAILRFLIDCYIDMRDNHKGKPFESALCRQAREAYRKANDKTERFFDDCLQRDDIERISYGDLLALWVDFFGDSEKKATARSVVKRITDRFSFTYAKHSGDERYVCGICATVPIPKPKPDEQEAESANDGVQEDEDGINVPL